MNRNAVPKIMPVFLFFTVCFATPPLALSQQMPDASPSGIYSTAPNSAAASAPSGIYSDAPVLSRNAAAALAGQMGLASSNLANPNTANAEQNEAKGARSAWLAGSAKLGIGANGAWAPTAGSFGLKDKAAWTAGASGFGITRQTDGIWRLSPATAMPSGAAPRASAFSLQPAPVPGSSHFPSPLTAKGAALVGGGFSSPFGSHHGAGSGFSSPASGPFSIQPGISGTSPPFASHGNGDTSTQQFPSSGTLTGPSMPTEPTLDDTLHLNDGLESPGTHDP